MRIEHAAAYVRDLEAARQFFETYFSASAGELYHNQKTGFRSYFLSFGEGARLELMSRPDVTEGQMQEQTGYAHLAFSIGSAEDVDTLTRKLKENGYAVISGPRITGDGYYESCILGPEGMKIEITI